ncbi:phosphoesterase [Lentilactobacillus senioris DSM 24302 = JCM 17472]|uniref:Phosphoesterase n=2 Tax=Lentilactobacillus senioris TaxID=931534 RepID=A0A0R2CPJ3_9LACO|nr:metallophosphoesterase [Lentilactobacillus senioris]KRM93697.1 phosphoesterase [Lentilactobacillus senioris DSM 24302 = JCM 17472]
MKLLVVSDSHGDRQIIADLLDHYQDQVEAVIHCGDSELKATDSLLDRLTMVQGNMDLANFPLIQKKIIDNQTILVTHGHRFGVNGGLLKLELLAQQENANLVFFGHTHQLGAEISHGQIFINPGSIAQPRGKYAFIGGTYAIVETLNNQVTVKFYDRNFDPIPELECHFNEGDD